jgi:hypothetical protein
VELRVTGTTVVTVIDGDDKTELKADKVAELLTREQFKVGSTMKYVADGEGNARTITFGTAKKKKKTE